MAVTATFQVTGRCSGGEHADFTVTIGARSKTVRLERDAIREDLTDDDFEGFARVVAGIFLRQLTTKTWQQLQTSLAGKVVDFTVVG